MTSKGLRKPEVLAPAGDMERAYLAAEAGADAVYFGLNTLSARTAATNIQDSQLTALVKALHRQNTRCYVALNTILYQSEFAAAEAYLQLCETAKVDALIIQDLAWLKLIAEYEKSQKHRLNMEIHASTQMNIHSDLDLAAARKLGFDRIVLPREVSSEQLEIWSKYCRNQQLDMEVFVHGAVCMGVSGRCQMSYMQGGRSANRGSCAQACRLVYQLFDAKHHKLDQGALLSAKDQSLLTAIPQFFKWQIKSLKIEGRMKDASYVQATTSAFRQAVDLWADNQDEKNFREFVFSQQANLIQVFNRGGNFTQRAFFQSPADEYVSQNFVGNYGVYLGTVKDTRAAEGKIILEPLHRPNASKEILSSMKNLQVGDQIAVRRDNIQLAVAPIGKLAKCNNQYIIKGFHPKKIALLKVGDQVFRLKSMFLENKLKNQNRYRLPIHLTVLFSQTAVHLSARTQLANQILQSDIAVQLKQLQSASQPLTETRWREQLAKCKNSPFSIEKINFQYQTASEIPPLKVSAINQLRRRLLETISYAVAEHIEIDEKRHLNRYSTGDREFMHMPAHAAAMTNPLKNLYSLIFPEQLHRLTSMDLSFVDQLEIPMLFLGNLKISQKIFQNLFKKYPNIKILIRLPEIMQKKQYELYEILLETYLYQDNVNFSGNGISALFPQLYYGKLQHLNEQANIINRETLNFYLQHHDGQISLSPEWNDDSLDETLNRLDDMTCAKIYLPYDYLMPEMFLNYCPVGKNRKNCQKCLTHKVANWSQTYSLLNSKMPENRHHLVTYPLHCVSQIYTGHADNRFFNQLSEKNKKRVNYRRTLR